MFDKKQNAVFQSDSSDHDSYNDNEDKNQTDSDDKDDDKKETKNDLTNAKTKNTKSSAAKDKHLLHYALTTTILSILGIIVSFYSSWHHLKYKASKGTDALCNINQKWSCDNIAASEYSEFLNIPLGIWGLGFFIATFTISLLLVSKKALGAKKDTHISTLVFMTIISILLSLVLGSISLFIIGSYCITCTLIYFLCLLLAISSFVYIKKSKFKLVLFRPKHPNAPWHGSITAIVLVIITIAAYKAVTQDDLDPKEFVDHPEQNDKKRMEIILENFISKTVYDIPINGSDYSGFGKDYQKGNKNARFTIVEFADFQCPACAKLSLVSKKILADFPQQVNWVFKNFPLDSSCNDQISARLHKDACSIAILARCAGIYNLFWQLHDEIFANNYGISINKAKNLAKDLGISENQINKCLKSTDLLNKVKDDIEIAKNLNVNSTPSVYINGKKFLKGASHQNISLVLNALIKQSMDNKK